MENLNRSSFAFLVALLIHTILILLFWILGTFSNEIKTSKKEPEKKLKISLKELPLKYKKSGLTKTKTSTNKPLPKGSQLNKLIKKPLIKVPKKQKIKTKLNKKRVQKVSKKSPKKIVSKVQKPLIPLDKPKVEKVIPKKEETQSDPMSWLSEDRSQEEKKKVIKQKSTSIGGTKNHREMKKLYGSKWGELTTGQQRYMIDNLEVMRRITQKVLNRVARVSLPRNINVNRTNIIEFYLHPNGDMTNFRFLKKSGYFELDNITKETIEYSYAKYPRPKEKILIRYNVYYNLARY